MKSPLKPLAAAALLASACAAPRHAPPSPSPASAAPRLFDFRRDFWVGLHHFLYPELFPEFGLPTELVSDTP